MMDLFKLKVSSKFMKGFVAKTVSHKIYKKLGYKTDILFNEISVDTVDNDVVIHINGDLRINRTELERLLETID